MKISKLLISGLLLSGLITSCDDNDDKAPDPVIPGAPTAAQGVYALTEGNFYQGIGGGLDILNFQNGSVDKNIFLSANGRTLGDTPQCGVAYGSKIYVGTSESNTIEIFDRLTWRSIKQIRVAEVTSGGKPYSMIANDGKVFISMFGGNLSRLDTLTLSIDKTVAVGNNPDQIALHKGKIYVPISDGMSYPDYGKTAVVVDPVTMQVEKTFNTALNPREFFTAGGRLFLLCMGNYGDVASALYEVKSGYTLEYICDATMASAYGDKIAIINQPFRQLDEEQVNEYKLYSLKDGKLSDWNISRPDYANRLYYDEAADCMLIASYVMAGVFPSYELPGYVNQYDGNSLTPSHRYNLGSAGRVCFFSLQK